MDKQESNSLSNPFSLFQKMLQESSNSNSNYWIKFNCRGTIIEANPISITRSQHIYEKINSKEWTSQSIWRLDVNPSDFHLFLDYLCESDKNIIKNNSIVARLCEEFEVDVDRKKKINIDIDNLIIEIVNHANKNKDAFALLTISDKQKLINIHSIQFLIPSNLMNNYTECQDHFDELINNKPDIIDLYLSFEKELKSIDGNLIPNKFKLIKKDDNYYIEAECELVNNLISQISQIIRCGNFEVSNQTDKIITSVKTECPIKWNGYFKNLSKIKDKERYFDIFIPEYHWIKRDKASIYPTITISSHIPLNGTLCSILNFVPDRNRIRGREYEEYPQVKILYNNNNNKCEIEICKLNWKINYNQNHDKNIKYNDEDIFDITNDDIKKIYIRKTQEYYDHNKLKELRLLTS